MPVTSRNVACFPTEIIIRDAAAAVAAVSAPQQCAALLTHEAELDLLTRERTDQKQKNLKTLQAGQIVYY